MMTYQNTLTATAKCPNCEQNTVWAFHIDDIDQVISFSFECQHCGFAGHKVWSFEDRGQFDELCDLTVLVDEAVFQFNLKDGYFLKEK